jgi:AraC-like DNA-binding protein
MNTTVSINALSLFIFFGVIQGIILSFFYLLKPSPDGSSNTFQGLLLLSISLCILEEFLNITGLIVRVLPVTNTTEPLNLVIGPLLYLYVKRSIGDKGSKKEWGHFLLAILYLCYMFFEFRQSNEFKYNSYVYSMHPGWPTISTNIKGYFDPLNIKRYLNLVTALQAMMYIALSLRILVKKALLSGRSLFRTDDGLLRSLRNMTLHFLIIFSIFIIVKLNFKGDTGDYFIGLYVAFLATFTSLKAMNDSSYFSRSGSFMDLSMEKYRKSSLTEDKKYEILDSILHEFKGNRYFSDNLASLSELAKRIGESSHHVSQVINEKLGKSFFELLAEYRVEEAKNILADKKRDRLTIEEISELVGYNSKTAFNNAFRKLTGKTPSEFRKSIMP